MFESWYADIGKKIKNWAIWCFIIEAIGAVITGLVFLISWGFEDAWWGLFIIFFGPIVAFVGSWLLYAFGELVEKICDIERNTRGEIVSEAQQKTKSERVSKLEHLRAKGLITEEEYQEAIAKEDEVMS